MLFYGSLVDTGVCVPVIVMMVASLSSCTRQSQILHVLYGGKSTIISPQCVMVSEIWVGMSANNIHLLQFKIQGYLQKRGLWMPVY